VKREPIAVAGAACAACCAPPVLGALGITVGVVALAWLAVGLLAAAVALTVGLAVVRRRA
jgi:hypothetical protein